MKHTFKQMREEWYSDVRSSYRPGKTAPIYKNPSSKEVFQMQRDNWETLNLIISGEDVYMFAGVLHHTVVKNIPEIEENDFISLVCEEMDGTTIMNVAPTTTMKELKSEWYNNDDIYDAIRDNPWMQRYMSDYVQMYNFTGLELRESYTSEIKSMILNNPDKNVFDITHYNIKRSSENYHTVIQDIEDSLRGMGYKVVDFHGETLEIHKK